jgi:hypothetical protein
MRTFRKVRLDDLPSDKLTALVDALKGRDSIVLFRADILGLTDTLCQIRDEVKRLEESAQRDHWNGWGNGRALAALPAPVLEGSAA